MSGHGTHPDFERIKPSRRASEDGEFFEKGGRKKNKRKHPKTHEEEQPLVFGAEQHEEQEQVKTMEALLEKASAYGRSLELAIREMEGRRREVDRSFTAKETEMDEAEELLSLNLPVDKEKLISEARRIFEKFKNDVEISGQEPEDEDEPEQGKSPLRKLRDEESLFFAAHQEAAKGDLTAEAKKIEAKINELWEIFEPKFEVMEGENKEALADAARRLEALETRAFGSPAERAAAERYEQAKERIGKLLKNAEECLADIEGIDPERFQDQELVGAVYAVSPGELISEHQDLSQELRRAWADLGGEAMNRRIAVAVAFKNHEIKDWQERRRRVDLEISAGVEVKNIDFDPEEVWCLEKIAANMDGHPEFAAGRELFGRNSQPSLSKGGSLVLIGEREDPISTKPVERLFRAGNGYILETNDCFYRLTLAEAKPPAEQPAAEPVEEAAAGGDMAPVQEAAFSPLEAQLEEKQAELARLKEERDGIKAPRGKRLPKGEQKKRDDLDYLIKAASQEIKALKDRLLSPAELLADKQAKLEEIDKRLSAKTAKGKPELNREARNSLARDKKKLLEQIALLEEQLGIEHPASQAPAPDNLPVAEPAPAIEAPLTPEEAAEQQLIEQARVEVEHIHDLPPAEKQTVLEFLVNFGYSTQEWKGKGMAWLVNKLQVGKRDDAKSKKIDQSGWNRYVKGLAMTYENDAERAKQARKNQSKGLASKLSGLGGLGGNMLKVGRVLVDAVQFGTARSLNPFRHATVTALAVGRLSEAGKEARLMNENLIQEGRIEKNDLDRAWEEAKKLHEMAGLADIRITNPDGSLNQANLIKAKTKMELAYRDQLPEDLKGRLGRIDGAGLKLLGRAVHDWTAKSIDKLDGMIKAIENDQTLSPEERSVNKHRILIKNEKLLRDLDRIVADQGAVDAWAYSFRQIERAGKTTANLLMIDSVYRFFKHLPELAEWSGQWNRLAEETAEQPQSSSRPTAAAPQAAVAAGEIAAEQEVFEDSRYGFVGEGEKYLRVGPQGQPGSLGPDSGPSQPPAVAVEAPRPAAPPLPETATSSQLPPAPRGGGALAESAVVKQGDGVTRILARQISADPARFGYQGDKADAAAVRRFASETATRVAAETGYLDQATGQEVRLGTSSIGRAAYVLENNGGRLSVHEYLKDQTDGNFASQEVHQPGSGFEGQAHEKYEYLHGRGTGQRLHGGAAMPEEAELGRGNEQIPAGLRNPHLAGGTEDAFAAADGAPNQEFLKLVGADQAGEPLISETEALRAGINVADGISPAERGQLAFWAGHRESLPNGDEAKAFFSLADRAKLEYSEAAIKSYLAMPEPLKAMPGRSAGYLKLFAAENQHAAAAGFKEFLGLETDRTVKWSGMERTGDGVIVAKGLSLGQNSSKIDVYISADRVGLRKPTSFLGLGNWDWFRGEWGVSDGRPQTAMTGDSLRRLTYRLQHLDVLIAKNDERFEAPAEYPGLKREISLPPEGQEPLKKE